MLLFSILLIFVYLLISKQIKDSLLRRIIQFFVVLYGAQICLAIWDPYKIYQVSYLSIIFFHVQIFLLIKGAQLCRMTEREKSFLLMDFNWPKIKINKFMLLVITIFFLYSYYNFNRMQSLLFYMANNSNEGRELYFTVFFPSYASRIIDMFITSFKYIAFFIAIILLFNNGLKLKIKELYFISLTFISYVLQLLTSQSRTESFIIVFMFVLMAWVSSIYDPDKYKKKVLPLVLLIIVGVGAVFFSVTLLRVNLTNEGFDTSLIDELFIQPFATYFYVPILAFDYTKDTLLNLGFPLLGCATFASLVDTLLLPLTYIDSSFGAISMNTIIGNSIGEGMYFPSGKHWMAMFTGCANYYLDFWYLGFVIFPFLHGWLLAKLVYSFRIKVSSFILLAFFFYMSFRHATASGIQSIDTMFFLFWMYLTLKSKAIGYCFENYSPVFKM